MPTPNLVIKFAGLSVYVQGSGGMFHVLLPHGMNCADHVPRINFEARNYSSVRPSIPKQETLETFDGSVVGTWKFRGLVQVLPGGKSPACTDHSVVAPGLRLPKLGNVQAGSGQVSPDLLGPNPGPFLAARVDVPTGSSSANPMGIMALEFYDPSNPGNVVYGEEDYAMGVITTLPLAQNDLGQWTVVFASPGYHLELVTDNVNQDIEVVISNLPALPETPAHFGAIWDFSATAPAVRALPRESSGGAGQAGCVGGEMDP